jgi:hypothetical protein
MKALFKSPNDKALNLGNGVIDQCFERCVVFTQHAAIGFFRLRRTDDFPVIRLHKLNDEKKMNMRIISAKDHGDSFRTLESGRAVAFMMDDALLVTTTALSFRSGKSLIGPPFFTSRRVPTTKMVSEKAACF